MVGVGSAMDVGAYISHTHTHTHPHPQDAPTRPCLCMSLSPGSISPHPNDIQTSHNDAIRVVRKLCSVSSNLHRWVLSRRTINASRTSRNSCKESGMSPSLRYTAVLNRKQEEIDAQDPFREIGCRGAELFRLRHYVTRIVSQPRVDQEIGCHWWWTRSKGEIGARRKELREYSWWWSRKWTPDWLSMKSFATTVKRWRESTTKACQTSRSRILCSTSTSRLLAYMLALFNDLKVKQTSSVPSQDMRANLTSLFCSLV